MLDVTQKKTLILEAVKKALRPLIRMLISSGLSYKDFTDMMRGAFLDEARRSIQSGGKDVTVSMLSLMSGIHRKDVAAYLKDPEDFVSIVDKYKSSGASAAFSVFSEWVSNPEMTFVLPYAKQDGKHSFTSLCEKLTTDVRPKAIVDELTRLGLVQYENGNVTLKKDAFVPENDFDYKLKFFSQNIYEHLESVSTNVMDDGPRKFERLAIHNNLTDDDIEVLKLYIDKHGMDLLKSVYHQAEDMASRNVGAHGTKKRKDKLSSFSVGIFTNFSKNNSHED